MNMNVTVSDSTHSEDNIAVKFAHRYSAIGVA